jgi:catechol 2,3-dioxygenase-like lactoylglutathione lyase family enzyme
MDRKYITGIQQIGVGVQNVDEAFAWYRKNFGMDVIAFREKAVAELMLPYTEGKKRERDALLAINMLGGGGFEIWQHTGKTPQTPLMPPELGDLGIFITKLRSLNASKAFSDFKSKGLNLLSEVLQDPTGNKHFFVKDPYDNIFQVVEDSHVFMETGALTGGVYGAIIGVSDMEKSFPVYKDILGYDQVVYDETKIFDEFAGLPGGQREMRRVLLTHSQTRTGSFAPMFGPTSIELVQLTQDKGKPLFKGRIWGDPGFIHLCFDVIGIDALRKEVSAKGFPFTVDSAESFDMGEAAGHFAYISDPDDTPIEFVETHKLPIIKKLGWYMNLKGRDPKRSLPRWMISTLKWKRVKD